MTRGRRTPFAALFEPRGVVVAGASGHPGKFGFVALHNILRRGYAGAVFATNRDGGEILGLAGRDRRSTTSRTAPPISSSCARRRARTPSSCARARGRACGPRSSTSAGYGEAGDEGRGAEARARGARGRARDRCSRGRTGRASSRRPSALCAQIVAPYPPPGRIGIASQSGNFVSSFLNYAVADRRRREPGGLGGQRGRGRRCADYLEYFADDPRPRSALAYVEGVATAARSSTRLRAVTARKPLVLLKGGATAGRAARRGVAHRRARQRRPRLRRHVPPGRRARGPRRSRRRSRPRPRSRRSRCRAGPTVAVVTTAGGWGVVDRRRDRPVRARRCSPLPDDLRAAIDAKLPPRWSRNNPIDLAGGETRDTIPEVLELVAGHPDVDAVVYLGLGIQSNQARLMRTGALLSRTTGSSGSSRTTSARTRASPQAAAEVSDAHRQARPHRHRARGRRSRQPRARERSARPGGSATSSAEPRGHRARAPLALRARHRAADRARHDADGRGESPSRSCVVAAVVARVRRGLAADDADADAPRPRSPAVGDPGVVGAPRAPNRSSTRSARSGCRRRSTPPSTRCGRLLRRRPPAAHALAAHGADTPLIGASTQKLLTARGRAGDRSGPTPATRRRSVAPAAPADGTVDRLWLVGGGDPVLTTGDYRRVPAVAAARPKGDVTTSLETLADAIVAAGRAARSPAGSSATTPATTPSATSRSWTEQLPHRRRGRSARRAHRQRRLQRVDASRKVAGRRPGAVRGRRSSPTLLRARGVAGRCARHRAPRPPDAAEIATVDVAAAAGDRRRSMLSVERQPHRRAAHPGDRRAGGASRARPRPASPRSRRSSTELGRADRRRRRLVDGSGLDRGNRVTCATLVAALDLGDRPEFARALRRAAGRRASTARSSTSFVGTAARRASSAARPGRSTA